VKTCPRCLGQRFEIFYRNCNLYRCGTVRMAKRCGECGGSGKIQVDHKMIAAGDK
jgi:hypothetical protein